MQANQSRGRAGPSGNDHHSVDDSPDAFQHSPLDPKVDCIRLVVIKPSEERDALVCCKLRHATFAEKPKYEALSYMWGDESKKRGITIDDKEFAVGVLLLGALQDLRDAFHERVFWIDAICINQRDIQEKNRQLSIMPYIYQRAKCVSVSLRHILNESDSMIEDWQATGHFASYNYSDIVRHMCDAQYWERVWIVQECSLARKLQIVSGHTTLSWETFINHMKNARNLEDSIPMRLHKQIEQKYTVGHKLQTLLESHQNARCTDPRDKVYGFIGLASDTPEGFPMDYRKSLFEVWKDTVMFKSADTESSRHDIMSFAKLVQKTLGGKAIASEEEISQDISLRLDPEVRIVELPTCPTKISIPGRLTGRINCLGPTCYEIISDLKQTAIWRSGINKFIPQHQRGSAREQSDLFLESLEEMEDEDFRAITRFPHQTAASMSWKVDNQPISTTPTEWDYSNDLEETWTLDLPDVPRLFLMVDYEMNSKMPSRNMGLAPSSARPGDYVCQIHGLQKAFVVRHDSVRGTLRLIGTAVLPRIQLKAQSTDEQTSDDDSKFETAHFDSIPDGEDLEIFIDVAMAYQLLD